MYGKKAEDFQNVFLNPYTAMDKAVNVRTKTLLSGFDVIYQQSCQTWYVHNGDE